MKKITHLIMIVLMSTFHCFGTDSTKVPGSDAMRVLLCESPTGLTVVNVTATGVQLAWTAPPGSDEIQFYQYSITISQTPDVGPTSTTNSAVSQIPLTPATTYFASVRSFCSGVWSDWSLPVSFTTLCGVEALPYLENFENASALAFPACTATQTPAEGNAWTISNNPGSGFMDTTLQYTANAEGANSWFFTKRFAMEAGVLYKLSFKYGNNSTTTIEKLAVTFSTNQDIAGLVGAQPFFTPITAISGGTQQEFLAGPFMAPAAGNFHLAFQVFSDASQGTLMVDDILIEQWICNVPASPTATGITHNSATITWNAPQGNPAQVYNYAVTTSAAPPASGTHFSPSLENLLTGLEAETTYYVHVRAMCSGVMSEWSSVSFTTESALAADKHTLSNLVVYPNPSTGRIFVSNDAPIDQIAVYSVFGQRIFEQRNFTLNAEVDLTGMQKGFYLLTVTSGGSSRTLNIVKY